MVKVKLPRVGEPLYMKKRYQSCSLEEKKILRIVIKQGTWFTKPYWDAFKDYLKKQGVSWQLLMEAWGWTNYYFIEWAEGSISWEEAFSEFERALNNIIG